VQVFGKNVSNTTVAVSAGGAALLGFSVYRYQKQKKAAAVTASVNAAAQSANDPATGYPYGSAEDAAALTAQSNYIAPTGSGGYGYGGGNTYPVTQPGQFTSNAAWSQAAELFLVGQGGDANAIGNALGKYITGQPVDSTSQSLINQAIAFEGYPPVPGPNGFPPSMNTANPGSTGSDGGSTQPTGAIIQSLPDGSGGWESVTFPNQAAWDAWTMWNQNFAATHGGRTQAYRSEWNQKLTELGAFGTNGPLKPPSNVTGNPNDAR
jgi:hypothetical protein